MDGDDDVDAGLMTLSNACEARLAAACITVIDPDRPLRPPWSVAAARIAAVGLPVIRRPPTASVRPRCPPSTDLLREPVHCSRSRSRSRDTNACEPELQRTGSKVLTRYDPIRSKIAEP